MAEANGDIQASAVGSTKSGLAPSGAIRGSPHFDRADWWSFGVTVALAFAGYGFTLAPDVTLGWSGMLATGAMYAGVPSPGGHPAWTLYSWLFTKLLPFSNVAWRVAVSSAVASAIACGLVAAMVSYFGRVMSGAKPHRHTTRAEMWLRASSGVAAGLVFAFSDSVWRCAVIVETQGLSVLLFTSVVLLVARWMTTPGRKRLLPTAFFLYGLLITNAQEMIVALPGLLAAVMLGQARLGRDVTLIVLPLALLLTANNQHSLWLAFPLDVNRPLLMACGLVALSAVSLIAVTRGVGTEWKCALLCGLGVTAGLAFCFCTPIASMTTPPADWGYPRTVEGFWHVIARGQFERVVPTPDLPAFLKQAAAVLTMIGRDLGWHCLAIALLPFGFFFRLNLVGRRTILGLLAIGLAVTALMITETNPPTDNPDAMGYLKEYFTPAAVCLAVGFGLGLIRLGSALCEVSTD